jgi:SAM-dependent methyltransferase
MDPAWYRTFFSGLAVDFWRVATTPEWTLADIDFAWPQLALRPGSRVLDCPCGHGRHSIELARRGCQVTGVDISQYSLTFARRSAEQAALRIEFVEADMLDLPDLGRFDAAITLGNSFGYMDHEGTSKFVRSVAAGLAPGGRWLIDCGAAAESLLPHLQPELTYEVGPYRMRACNSYLADKSCLETEYEIACNGKTETRRNWHFVFTVAEIQRMLRAAGLTLLQIYGSNTGEPFKLGSRMLYLVGEKPI